MATLIPEWKKSWKLFSQQVFVLIAVIQTLAATGQLQPLITDFLALVSSSGTPTPAAVTSFINWLTAMMGVVGLYARVLAQPAVVEAMNKAKQEHPSEEDPSPDKPS